MPMPKCKKICKVLYMKITTFYIIHNYYKISFHVKLNILNYYNL